VALRDFYRGAMQSNLPSRIMFAVMALPFLFSACTSEPLLSRKAGVAAGELVVQSMLVAGRGSSSNPVDRNIEASGAAYLGGVIPVKWEHHLPARPVEKGSRFFVAGHARGPIPLVANLAKPGPHIVRLEIAGWQPHTLKLASPLRLRVGEGEVESWQPLFVNCRTGEIFTTEKLPALPLSPGSGTPYRVRQEPMLFVTTTEHRQRGWSKIGEMKPIAVSR
jgi:hypothetical protein